MDFYPQNGLLLVVDGTGIPVLTRAYGEVQKPPSAVVGVLSAVYHASKSGNSNELSMLRSAHRNTVYLGVDHEFILIFISYNDFQCGSELILRAMLGAVYRVITIIVGTSALSSSRSTPLRASIARHADILDYVVTQYAYDVRLSLSQPISLSNSIIHNQKLRGLYHGFWLKGKDIVCETNPIHCPFYESEVALLMVYADLYMNNKFTLHTAHMRTALMEIPVRFAVIKLSDGTTFLGIFTIEAASDEIQDILDRAKELVSSSHNTISLPIFYSLLPSLISCYVTSSSHFGGLPCRTLYIANPNCSNSSISNETIKPSTSLLQRHILGRFVTYQSTRSIVMGDVSRDYVYRIEGFTLTYARRGPVIIYAIHNVELSLEDAIESGDRLASIFITSQ